MSRNTYTRSVNIDKLTLIKLEESYKEEAQTIVHCKYVSKHKYINGGWVNIFPTTYLSHNNEYLQMVHAVNIPIAPDIHIFKKKGELKLFTLFFPSIPKDWDSFSLIENCENHEGFQVINIKRNNSGIYEIALY
jgi:hypothetical protein